MFLKFKIATVLCTTGLISSYLAQLGKSCSDIKTNYFYKSLLNVTESVLDCEGSGRSYSVFLDFQEDKRTGIDSENSISFKVVDNKTEKVKWGPKSDSSDVWMDWGIGVYKKEDVVDGIRHTAVIRVPAKGNFYNRDQHWSSIRIPCQKNNLKLKTETDESSRCNACGGRLFRSKDMKLEILHDGRVNITKNFDFKDNFRPKKIWCTS